MQEVPSDYRNGYGILKISTQGKAVEVKFPLTCTKQK